MDAVGRLYEHERQHHSERERERGAEAEVQADTIAAPSLPPGAPLEMPVQSLAATQASGRLPALRGIALRRFGMLPGTVALTAFAVHEMYLVLQVAGLTILEYLVLLLFVALFAWAALSFVTNLAGFVFVLAGGPRRIEFDESVPLPEMSSRTALLFPIYNEEATRVMARLQAMHESLSNAGALATFDFFVLSDTTKPDVWITEEAAFLEVRERTQGQRKVFYRIGRATRAARRATSRSGSGASAAATSTWSCSTPTA